jgi:prolyl-tRNA editing enzyme YbaK/EbsC (Cys-tRNA(Pro) deacylase)
MSLAQVKAFLASRGMAERVLEFAASTATVELAAQEVGCAPARIAKSMSFLVDGKPLLVVLAGDVRVDNHKFKQAFHKKGRMIPFDQVETLIGHAPGGVCPFCLRDGVPVYLDVSLKDYDVVYPAAGNDRSAVRLTPEELFALSGAKGWVDVAKAPET